MESSTQTNYAGWTLVELFGHQKEAGFVTAEYFGTAAMFRIDVPGFDEREWTLERPEYGPHTDYRELPVGTRVKRSAVAPRSRLVGVSAIYGMTPCTEDVARLALERSVVRPLIVLSMPEQARLVAAVINADQESLARDEEEECDGD